MIFDYNVQKTFANSIDVVDIGNTCLCCDTVDGSTYYLITKTIMGKTAILTFGPTIEGINTFLDVFNLNYFKMDYSDKKIKKQISTFLNDSYKKIDTVSELQPEEAYAALPNIIEAFITL